MNSVTGLAIALHVSVAHGGPGPGGAGDSASEPEAAAASASHEPAARRRERAGVIGLGVALAGGVGLGLLGSSQIWRWTRDRRILRRCAQEAAEDPGGDEQLDPIGACFHEARHPFGVGAAAFLGFLGGAVVVSGAVLTAEGLARLGRADGTAPRTTPRIVAGAALTAIGGAAVVIGGPVLFAMQRRGGLDDRSRWQGARFLVTDAGIVVAAVGLALVTHAVVRGDRRGRRRAQVVPVVTRHGAGVTATLVW